MKTKALFLGVFVLLCLSGCHHLEKTPSKDAFSYKFMKKEWTLLVREVVSDPERQEKILHLGKTASEKFQRLNKESEEIEMDYLATMACYECGLDDFDPIIERIRQLETASILLILDLLEGTREQTTEEEMKTLIKRKFKL